MIHKRTRRLKNLQEKLKTLNMRFQYQLKGMLVTIRKRVKSYGGLFVRHLRIILDYKAEVKHFFKLGGVYFMGGNQIHRFSSPLKNICTLKISVLFIPRINSQLT